LPGQCRRRCTEIGVVASPPSLVAAGQGFLGNRGISCIQNVCYASDEQELYKVWDDDLRKQVRRAEIREVIGILCFGAAYVVWRFGRAELLSVILIFVCSFNQTRKKWGTNYFLSGRCLESRFSIPPIVCF
jgi:hypothetical protein